MNFEQFTNWKPHAKSKLLLDAALAAYQEMADYSPTLRTIYYQLVADNIILNTENSYDRLGSLLTRAREGGLFPWDALEDKGRITRLYRFNEDNESVFHTLPWHIAFDYWGSQSHYVEVWVEKQAQEGAVKIACEEYGVPWLACKGYVSATAMYDAGKRFEEKNAEGKQCVLIHLGDHDPSGIDMTRDNLERVRMFSRLSDEEFTISRIALNMDQIKANNLPPNPAKVTDSRFADYKKKFGSKSWELDALKPKVMCDMIREEIQTYIDKDAWDEVAAEEDEERAPLVWAANHPDKMIAFAIEQMNAPKDPEPSGDGGGSTSTGGRGGNEDRNHHLR